jgi:hypothetical protein
MRIAVHGTWIPPITITTSAIFRYSRSSILQYAAEGIRGLCVLDQRYHLPLRRSENGPGTRLALISAEFGNGRE